uniref:Uncharacterized protein n=1 Tax=Plectus sambesii TaxID=2011161 RepID=A0A914WUJ5_9BILA
MNSTIMGLLLLATMALLWETTQACSIGMKVVSRTNIKFSVGIFKPHNVLKRSLILSRKGDEQSWETAEEDCLGTYKLKFKGITGTDSYNYNRKFNRDGVLHVQVETDENGLLIVHDDFIPSDFVQKK